MSIPRRLIVVLLCVILLDADANRQFESYVEIVYMSMFLLTRGCDDAHNAQNRLYTAFNTKFIDMESSTQV